MLKPVVNSESYIKLVKTIHSQSVVECRFPQSSDVTEVICAQPQVSAVSCEASSGRVNYSGKLVLTIVYSDEEGKLCRMQKGAEFAHFADDDALAPANTCHLSLNCEKLSIKREGSSYVIAAIITAKIGVYARTERTVITAAEGAHVKTDEVNFFSYVCFNGESEVEDDFDADSIVDVLTPNAKALINYCVCGTGEVEVGGDIYLSLLAMRQQSPVCIERIIPFKSIVVCDDAAAGVKACADVEITDLKVTATVQEERGKCNVGVSASLNISGWFCDLKSGEAAKDAFSETNQLKIESAEESFLNCGDIKVYGERVSGLAASKSRLTYDCVFLAAALPDAECGYNTQSGCAEGAITATLIYAQNGEIKSSEVQLPFSVALKGVSSGGEVAELSAAVCGVSVRLKAEGEPEAEATLKIIAKTVNEAGVKYISALEEGEALPLNDCAVSVFMPAAGDGLWEVAKKLNKSPEEIASCNKDLKFPLSGSERILVYRGKKAQ